MFKLRSTVSFSTKASLGAFRSTQIAHWLYSPSGRFAIDVDEWEVSQDSEEKVTHYYRHEFNVLDLSTNTWSRYSSNSGAFHRLHSFYWLDDEFLVLVDFSRYNRCLTQNLIQVCHSTKTINCAISRKYHWEVDELLEARSTNVTPLILNGKEWLCVFAFRDTSDQTFLRLLPYGLSPSQSASKEIVLREKELVTSLVPSTHPPRVTGHPFVIGHKILLRYEICSPFSVCEYASSFVSIDMEMVLRKAFDEVLPGNPAVSWLRIPLMNSMFREVAVERGRYTMYNTSSHVIYFIRNTSTCLFVDFQSNLCNWIGCDIQFKEESWGIAGLHPSGEVIYATDNVEKTGMEMFCLGQPLLQTQSLANLARATMLREGKATGHAIDF